jgi:hypothetical protein
MPRQQLQDKMTVEQVVKSVIKSFLDRHCFAVENESQRDELNQAPPKKRRRMELEESNGADKAAIEVIQPLDSLYIRGVYLNFCKCQYWLTYLLRMNFGFATVPSCGQILVPEKRSW